MKFRMVSDLHLDFSRYRLTTGEDEKNTVLLIAGDIARPLRPILYKELFDDLSARFKLVLFVAGNHDYWRISFVQITEKMLELCEDYENIIFLQDDYVFIEDILVVGATLWTMIYDELDRYITQNSMLDYKKIRTGTFHHPFDRRLRVTDTCQAHLKSIDRFRTILRSHQKEARKTVMLTHHAPHRKSCDPRYADNGLDPAYYTDLTDFIDEYQIDYWIHGHIHRFCDYQIGSARVLCNPRGYETMKGREFTAWDDTFFIEI